MTLAEFYGLDFAALWVGLSVEQQAAIIEPLLASKFAEVCQDDDGTDCSKAEREEAAGIVQDSFQALHDAIDAAFPQYLAPDFTALHDLDAEGIAEAKDRRSRVRVKGYVHRFRIKPFGTLRGWWCVEIEGREVEIGGFKNIAGADRPPVWEAWTIDQVEAERLRRHPEQAGNRRHDDFAEAA